jgi:hypothetical protein
MEIKKMDKQKQIEEMAKLVQQDMCGDIPCEECNYHGKMKILPRYCGTYLIVEKLYRAGYRKIPENAVVLTREEYNELQKGVKTHNYTAMFEAQDAYRWEQGYFQGCKETAKEILEKVKSYTLDKEVGMRYLIQRLGEEYGVE